MDNGVSWEEAFFTDNRDLISENQIMEIDPTGKKGIVIKIRSENTQVARLPCPLPFMNYRQCADWLREQMSRLEIVMVARKPGLKLHFINPNCPLRHGNAERTKGPIDGYRIKALEFGE